MTAKSSLPFDPKDPVALLGRILQVETQLTLAQQSFDQTAKGLSENLSGLRGDIKELSEQMRELPRLTDAQDAQNEAQERAFRAIKELGEKTQDAFRYRDEAFNDWREKHEADNRNTREKLILWNGVGIGISMLAACLVGTVLYIYNEDKAATRIALAKAEQKHLEDVTRIENGARGNSAVNAAAIAEIERYLTQEGTVNGRPYVPPRQR